jgi:DNA repair exonuclease SbcCD ATPase subunit
MQSVHASDFTGMLQEIQGKFDVYASLPFDTVQELEQTIANLQKIKNELEETDEYRAAQAEKERALKGNRALQLKKRVEESKAAAEKMLGFPLTPQLLNQENMYKLMPMGFVDRSQFNAQLQQYQMQNAIAEEKLDQLKGELGDLKFRSKWSSVDNTKSQIQQLEFQVHITRTRLLSYMMAYQPMLDTTFSETLAAHLDAMLEAYLELRKLECSEAKA